MAYDPDLGRIVLFGGGSASCALKLASVRKNLSETWLFDGGWSAAREGTEPVWPAPWTAMTYDQRLHGVLLLEKTDTEPSPQSWLYTASGWTRLPSAPPVPNLIPALAYDGASGQAILLAGQHVWSFDGAAWAPMPSLPAAFIAASVAYDDATGAIVAVGTGADDEFETLVSSGGNWNRVDTETKPPAPEGMPGEPTVSFDKRLGKLLLFYGELPLTAEPSTARTWSFDGQDWRAEPAKRNPPLLVGEAMTDDTASGETVIFGGSVISSGAMYGDLWTYNGESWMLLAKG